MVIFILYLKVFSPGFVFHLSLQSALCFLIVGDLEISGYYYTIKCIMLKKGFQPHSVVLLFSVYCLCAFKAEQNRVNCNNRPYNQRDRGSLQPKTHLFRLALS